MTTTTSHNNVVSGLDQPQRRLTTETKSALKTTEFFAFVAMVLAVVVTANFYDGDGTAGDPFGATTASPSDRSPGPHRTTDISPCRSRSATATAANRLGGQRLFGHAASATTPDTQQLCRVRIRPLTRTDLTREEPCLG